MLQHSYKTILANKPKKHFMSFYLLRLSRILETFCETGKQNRLTLQVAVVCTIQETVIPLSTCLTCQTQSYGKCLQDFVHKIGSWGHCSMSRVSMAAVFRSVRLRFFVKVRNMEYSLGITFCLKLEQAFQTYGYYIHPCSGEEPTDVQFF